MFSGLKRAFGVITLKIKDDIVHIEGIPADVIRKDISKIWSNRVTNNLFESMDDNGFSVRTWFLIDLLYAIDEILKDKGSNASVRSLNKIKEKLLEETWLANTTKTFPSKMDMSKLSDFHFTPLEHQAPFFEYYDQTTQRYGLNGVLIAAAAGSGKSLLSLMTMRCLKKKTVIIVSPANALEEVWVKTLNTGFKKPVTFWTSKSKEPIRKGLEYYVITYEYLSSLLEQIGKIDLSDVGIILDESHRFNTPDSLRTVAFVELCKTTNSKDVLWLSGTPIKALTTEVLAFFSTVDPLFTEGVITRFKKIFGVSSARATDMMANRLGISLFIVQKKTLGLPEPLQEKVLVKIPNGNDFTLANITKNMVAFVREREAYYATRKKDDNAFYYGILDDYEKKLKTAEERLAYTEFRKNLKITIQCGGDARFCALNMKEANKYEKTKIIPTLTKEDAVKFKDIKSIVKYVKLKIQGEALARIIGRARIDCAVAVSKHVDYNSVIERTIKKTLIFTNYVEVMISLMEILPKQDLDARFVYAKTNSQLSSIIKEYDTKEEVNPLVATYASLSTAVPVTSASGVLILDAPFREYIINQAISRAWRVGQDTQVTVTTVVLDTGNEPNISSRTVDILQWSASQVEAITGVKSPVVNTDSIDGLNVALEGYALASKATPEDMEANYMLALEDLLDENEDKPEEPLSVIPPYMSW